ncbi:MAG: hypothetical protein AVDCRST_MAG86-705 [uncultured Truepera sp.]|uniref:Streptomycin 6-kinase n=1 Tax=uncultured Truepera sp. TaxID=543023 RepID=A0A6J4USW6_9DEIN|nr:MAG: hypothetical protein AVDCRST_MAG86-705 [uncultured Truepera sp.]
MNLPKPFLRTLRNVHADVDAWVVGLPETLAGLEALWHIRVTGLVPQLLYNLVAHAERADGTPCILKLSPPSDDLRREGQALSLYAGDGICRLLERDEGANALLLERLTPGVSLQELWTLEHDDAHTRVAAQLMQRLWRRVPEPHPFRPLRSWARELWDYEGTKIPAPQRVRARALLLELGPNTDPILLHADLHHGNILTTAVTTGSEPYLAIDPKGIVGARGYDVGTYLLNPVQATAKELTALAPQRLETFSRALGLSQRDLAALGFVHAVLSACWDADNHGDWDGRALEVARGLEPLV